MPGVLYYNGDILTIEPQLYAPANLVESGRIRAVGSKQQLEAAQSSVLSSRFLTCSPLSDSKCS